MPNPTSAPWTTHRLLNYLFLAVLTAVIAVGADRIIHEAWRHALGASEPID